MTLAFLTELVKEYNNCLVVESVLELPKEIVDYLNKTLKEDGTILISFRSSCNTSIKFFIPSYNTSPIPTWCYCNHLDYPNKISNTEFLKYFKEPPKTPKCFKRI